MISLPFNSLFSRRCVYFSLTFPLTKLPLLFILNRFHRPFQQRLFLFTTVTLLCVIYFDLPSQLSSLTLVPHFSYNTLFCLCTTRFVTDVKFTLHYLKPSVMFRLNFSSLTGLLRVRPPEDEDTSE